MSIRWDPFEDLKNIVFDPYGEKAARRKNQKSLRQAARDNMANFQRKQQERADAVLDRGRALADQRRSFSRHNRKGGTVMGSQFFSRASETKG